MSLTTRHVTSSHPCQTRMQAQLNCCDRQSRQAGFDTAGTPWFQADMLSCGTQAGRLAANWHGCTLQTWPAPAQRQKPERCFAGHQQACWLSELGATGRSCEAQLAHRGLRQERCHAEHGQVPRRRPKLEVGVERGALRALRLLPSCCLQMKPLLELCWQAAFVQRRLQFSFECMWFARAACLCTLRQVANLQSGLNVVRCGPCVCSPPAACAQWERWHRTDVSGCCPGEATCARQLCTCWRCCQPSWHSCSSSSEPQSKVWRGAEGLGCATACSSLRENAQSAQRRSYASWRHRGMRAKVDASVRWPCAKPSSAV